VCGGAHPAKARFEQYGVIVCAAKIEPE